jgi:cysteine synthase
MDFLGPTEKSDQTRQLLFIRHVRKHISLQGAVPYNWYKHGKMERTEGGSICEGIGQGRITNNLDGAPVDDALLVPDTDSVNMVSE